MFHVSPEAELLKRLLELDQDSPVPYIWDPQSPETEAYLQSLEQAWPADITADYGTIAPTFQKALNLTSVSSVSSSLASALSNGFPGVPQAVLQHLVTKAHGTGLEALALSEQLLQCVQDLFPRWTIEDLQVLVRPYAYAFRSGSPSPSPAEAIEWEQLSDLEQIRLCFQVSKAILNEVHPGA